MHFDKKDSNIQQNQCQQISHQSRHQTHNFNSINIYTSFYFSAVVMLYFNKNVLF